MPEKHAEDRDEELSSWIEGEGECVAGLRVGVRVFLSFLSSCLEAVAEGVVEGALEEEEEDVGAGVEEEVGVGGIKEIDGVGEGSSFLPRI